MSNMMHIAVINEHVLTESILNKIDVDNVIASYTNPEIVTIPNDGFCYAKIGPGGYVLIILNNKEVAYLDPRDGADASTMFPVKKGDVLDMSNTNQQRWATIYGYRS